MEWIWGAGLNEEGVGDEEGEKRDAIVRAQNPSFLHPHFLGARVRKDISGV